MNQTNPTGVTSSHTFPWSIPGAIFINLLILSSLLTNIFVCVVIMKYHSLRTITNYFIVNLCVSDSFVALTSMPMWMVFLLYGPELERNILSMEIKIFWNLSDIFFGTTAIVSLAAISIDKLIAITMPLHYLQLVTTKRAIICISFIWVYSLTVALFKLIPWPGRGYVIFNAPASFFCPLLIILVSYGKIFLVARRHASSIKLQQKSQEQVEAKAKRGGSFRKRSKSKIISVAAELKAAKTVLTVILSFICCWLPFIVTGLCMAHNVPVSFETRVTIKWFTYVNALVNPLVYTFFDRKFRSTISRRVFNVPCGRDMNASSAYENTSLTYTCPMLDNHNDPDEDDNKTSANDIKLSNHCVVQVNEPEDDYPDTTRLTDETLSHESEGECDCIGEKLNYAPDGSFDKHVSASTKKLTSDTSSRESEFECRSVETARLSNEITQGNLEDIKLY